jgi:hypothetical protein
MRISTVVLGKAVRNAGISGRHVITKGMRKIQSIGQNIERWERDEVQIPGTKIALERAILDALGYWGTRIGAKEKHYLLGWHEPNISKDDFFLLIKMECSLLVMTLLIMSVY